MNRANLNCEKWENYPVSPSQFLSQCTASAISDAAQVLANGGLVAFPTETVYGLGADANNADAVARIYEVKGRPSDHPLIVHIASMQQMGQWSDEIPEFAIDLARDFWPGPMTLILKRSDLAKDFITGGQNTVGVRIPNHVVALALLEAAEKVGIQGIAAPSANRFGQLSPTTAAAVQVELGAFMKDADLVIDGGTSAVGVESTIIDCTSDIPRVLRPGAITDEMIVESTGLQLRTHNAREEEIRVSGSLENHYAPIATVILDQQPVAGQGFIALANISTPEGVSRLAAPADNDEFAHLLYAALRDGDIKGLSHIVVTQPVGSGIAVAIRDRLMRAANSSETA